MGKQRQHRHGGRGASASPTAAGALQNQRANPQCGSAQSTLQIELLWLPLLPPVRMSCFSAATPATIMRASSPPGCLLCTSSAKESMEAPSATSQRSVSQEAAPAAQQRSAT